MRCLKQRPSVWTPFLLLCFLWTQDSFGIIMGISQARSLALSFSVSLPWGWEFHVVTRATATPDGHGLVAIGCVEGMWIRFRHDPQCIVSLQLFMCFHLTHPCVHLAMQQVLHLWMVTSQCVMLEDFRISLILAGGVGNMNSRYWCISKTITHSKCGSENSGKSVPKDLISDGCQWQSDTKWYKVPSVCFVETSICAHQKRWFNDHDQLTCLFVPSTLSLTMAISSPWRAVRPHWVHHLLGRLHYLGPGQHASNVVISGFETTQVFNDVCTISFFSTISLTHLTSIVPYQPFVDV